MEQPTGPMQRGSLSRRGFLRLMGSTAALAGLSGVGVALSSDDERMAIGTVPKSKLGCQLWNCQVLDLVDSPETLALIAEIGYEYVEFAIGFGSVSESDPATARLGMSAKAFRKALDDNGLWCYAGQGLSPYPFDKAAWKPWVEDNLVVGSRALGTNTPFPTTYSDCLRYVDAVYKAHEAARRMGFKGYLYGHMEAQFWTKLTDRPNTFALDVILRHTTKDVWNVQIDTGNSYAVLGSKDAVIRQVRKWPGRCRSFHVKDTVPVVYAPDGTIVNNFLAVTPVFGTGVWSHPDLADPENRPHAGFQDLLTAIRETQEWNDLWLVTESNGSQATCLDWATLAYRGLKGLKFPYRRRRARK